MYVHAPYKHFDDLVTCVWKLMAACQVQAGDCQSLKKSQPVIRERCKHEYTDIWNCLKPSTKGDTFVRCSTCQTDFSYVNGRRLDRLSDYRHIWNLLMKLRVKGKIRFIVNWDLQIYRDCIILFSNELSLHLNQYMYDYWSIKLFSDILCDSPTTNKFQIVISKNPMLVIRIFLHHNAPLILLFNKKCTWICSE